MSAERQAVEHVERLGDERAFELLYSAHADRLYRFLLRLAGGDRNLVEDVFQETWVTAIAKLSKFERRSSFFTWLAGIAFNKFRHAVRIQPMELMEKPEEVPATTTTDIEIDLEPVLHRLPDGFRAVLVLHSEGFTHAEIGRQLGISDGTSKSQLSRARQAAVRLMGGDDDR